MIVTVLGSGSSGNATLVQAADVCILVDAGFSGRDIERRLLAAEVAPESIAGIVITHEHIDHTRGMGVMARRFRIPLYLTDATRQVCAGFLDGSEEVRRYGSTEPFRIGPLEVQPFLTAHDAVDPVAVVVRDVERGHKLGIATDMGRPTSAVRHALRDSHLLVLEANHDDELLWKSSYPWSVKQRIASSHGHLSNRAAAELVRELFAPDLAGVVLAHLSERCNDPGLANDTIGETLEGMGYGGLLSVARQDRPLEPINVAQLLERTAPQQLSLL